MMNAVETIQQRPELSVHTPAPTNGMMKDEDAQAAEPWEWTKLRRMALHQADKIISLLPWALNGGANDAINKIRVTSRRLECQLSLLYSNPFPQHVQRFREKLKASRRRLGELRNYDALILLVQGLTAHRPASESEVWKALGEYIQDLKQKNTPTILEDFCRINLAFSYVKFKRDGDPANHPRAEAPMPLHDGPIPEVLYERIMNSLQHEWKKFEETIEESRRHPQKKSIHSMRTAAKRLRYLMEVMKKLHIPGSAERLRWLRAVQDLVGRWHDLELLDHYMTEMVALPKFQLDYPHLAAKTEKAITHNHRIKAASERRFFWMTRKSPQYLETKAWLGEIEKQARD